MLNLNYNQEVLDESTGVLTPMFTSKEFTNRMFDCDRCPMRRLEPSQLHVRICSMNMAGQAAPPESSLAQWLCNGDEDQPVPDIVIVRFCTENNGFYTESDGFCT